MSRTSPFLLGSHCLCCLYRYCNSFFFHCIFFSKVPSSITTKNQDELYQLKIPKRFPISFCFLMTSHTCTKWFYQKLFIKESFWALWGLPHGNANWFLNFILFSPREEVRNTYPAVKLSVWHCDVILTVWDLIGWDLLMKKRETVKRVATQRRVLELWAGVKSENHKDGAVVGGGVFMLFKNHLSHENSHVWQLVIVLFKPHCHIWKVMPDWGHNPNWS